MSVDFPRAWEIARSVPWKRHNPKCSFHISKGGLLCDCHVLFNHPDYLDDVMHGEVGPVAWEVFLEEYNCFTFALTRKAAQWNAVSGGREVGYFQGAWPTPLAAVRTPQFDNSPLKEGAFRKCFSPDAMY